jgi:hypothetical protein
MLTVEEVAASLDGREYKDEVRRGEQLAWRNAGIVVAYGASDDLLELNGAIEDEFGAWNGTTVFLCADGAEDESNISVDPRGLPMLTAEWCPSGVEGSPAWVVSIKSPDDTTIRSAPFKIYEDGELFGIGVVFRVSDLPPGPLA